MGKSYIAVYVSALMLYSQSVTEVKVVYRDKKILDAEKPIRDAIAYFTRVEVNAKLIVELPTLKLKKNLLVIFDEADSWGFGDAFNQKLPTILGNGPLLCLSATGIKLGDLLERKHLAEVLKLWCVTTNWGTKDVRNSVDSIASFEAYLQAETKTAKVIYCSAQ